MATDHCAGEHLRGEGHEVRRGLRRGPEPGTPGKGSQLDSLAIQCLSNPERSVYRIPRLVCRPLPLRRAAPPPHGAPGRSLRRSSVRVWMVAWSWAAMARTFSFHARARASSAAAACDAMMGRKRGALRGGGVGTALGEGHPPSYG